MKLRLFISLQILLFISLNLYSQPEGYERMIDAQCNEILKALNLNDNKKEKDFLELYKNYLKEANENKRVGHKIYKADIKSITDKYADSLIIRNMAINREAINIKERYYFKLKKILTPKQIMVIYRTENDIAKRLTYEWYQRRQKNL